MEIRILIYRIRLQFTVQIVRCQSLQCNFKFANKQKILCLNKIKQKYFFDLSSQEEKLKWLQDLCEAIEKVKCQNDDKINYSSLKSNSK